jgi:hypothetical protein
MKRESNKLTTQAPVAASAAAYGHACFALSSFALLLRLRGA